MMSQKSFRLFLLFILAVLLIKAVVSAPPPDTLQIGEARLTDADNPLFHACTAPISFNNNNYSYQEFNCSAEQYREPPYRSMITYSQVEVAPLWHHNFVFYAFQNPNGRNVSQGIVISDCQGKDCANISVDFRFFCGTEGPVDLRIEGNAAEEPGTYNPLRIDCRPAYSCEDELLMENISGPLDNRPFELLVGTDINILWDNLTDPSHCDCFLGDTACNGNSCWDNSGALDFEGGAISTIFPCCGDDTALAGAPPTQWRETYNWKRCADTWDPAAVDTSACAEDQTDDACCNHVNDCVNGTVCYADDTNVATVEIVDHLTGEEMTCSRGVWCPRYFEYNVSSGMCEFAGWTACYSNDPTLGYVPTCQAAPGAEEYFDDVWIEPNPPPAADCHDDSASPDQCCCPMLNWKGAIYHRYQDADIY